MRKITFRSRYGDIRELVEHQPNEWTFSGWKITYMRIGENPEGEGYQFIDPDGGPFLSIGTKLNDELEISSIKFEDGRYKIITKEVKEIENVDKDEES